MRFVGANMARLFPVAVVGKALLARQTKGARHHAPVCNRRTPLDFPQRIRDRATGRSVFEDLRIAALLAVKRVHSLR